MAGKFDLKKSTSGKFYFSLKAGNGQIILTSEMYESKGGATNGIESVKRNASDDARYERKESGKGEPYFVLKAGNGEPIGRSENYSSTASMENGIQSVKENAPTATVEDNAG
ncbi:MAG TPA: YegP family protein [Pyrinomonadaceae bacterium]|nr:YegP family protein [Pyrinomonadaceae bacterium]